MRRLAVLFCVLSGCDLSSTGGVNGKVDFNFSDCGAILNDALGCGPKQPVAQGGLVTVSASAKQGGQRLPLRSDNPGVFKLDDAGGLAYTLTGVMPGNGNLIATDPVNGDQLAVEVQRIAQLSALELSQSYGTFTAAPGGGFDGKFEVNASARHFVLFFAQLDGQMRKLLGRDALGYDLDSGRLMLVDGPAHGLQFDFQRPAAGTYTFTLQSKAGNAAYKMQIIVK